MPPKFLHNSEQHLYDPCVEMLLFLQCSSLFSQKSHSSDALLLRFKYKNRFLFFPGKQIYQIKSEKKLAQSNNQFIKKPPTTVLLKVFDTDFTISDASTILKLTGPANPAEDAGHTAYGYCCPNKHKNPIDCPWSWQCRKTIHLPAGVVCALTLLFLNNSYLVKSLYRRF